MSNRGEMNIILQPRQQMRLDMQPSSHASRVGDYNELLNKPSVNGVELIGDKTSENLKIIISKAAEDWDSYADVVSYKDTAYVHVGPVTKVKYGDGVTTIGNLPFVSAEDTRISNEDITAWNAKADISDIPTTLAELGDDATHRLVTDDEKARWDSTVGNVQSDWNETDPSAGSFIKNKPEIPDDLADLNPDANHRLVTDTEKSIWNNKSDFSGSYTDLTNKPDIPANLSDLQDDANHRLTSDAEKTVWNAKSDFSGNYNDLTNKPDIPNDLADLNEDSTHRVVTDTEKAAWNAKSDFSGSYNDLTNKPKLADLTDDASHRTVSDSEKLNWDRKSDFSGSYDDLTDKPAIPDELTDLDDVSVTNIQNGQILKYNATTQKFENANESGGTVQDAYKKVKVANTEITASGEDTIEFVAGTNITLVPDAVNKRMTINSTGGGGGGSTGDMLKEIYDTNNDGIVNAADEATTLTGMTATVSELNALEGITSNVQSQLDDKADASDIPTALSDLSDDSTHRVVTDTEKSAWNAKSDFSGSYNDLTDKPTIPDDLADLNEDSTHRLVTDAEKTAWDAKSDFSGSYNDLTNKPSIPDDLADLSDDATHRLVTDVEKAAWDAKSDFSGSYNDLTNKPTIPNDLADLNEDSTHRLVTDSEKATWNGKSDFSGSYNDLTDKPSIPAAQIQSDWNQTSSSAVDYIKNKPSIPTDLADLQDDSTHRLVTDTEKSGWDNKSDFSGSYNDLTDKPSIPAPQIQSDWGQTDSTALDFIKNKPSIPSGQVQSDWNESDSTAVDFIKNKPTIPDELADLQDDASHRTVSDTEKSTWNNKSDFSGDYNDLTNKPTIPDELADLSDDATHRLVTDSEKSTWDAKSDFSGSYDDLTNKPTIPAAQVNSDWNASGTVAEILNKPSIPSDIDDLGDVAITNIQDGQVLKYNSTTQKFENADESGGAGGHIIENPAGTEMTQRTNLQFLDANVTDDSTNDKTKVENVKVIQSENELTNAPDGIYMGNYDDPTQHVAEANAIDYDNTDSGLDADNVQDAVDEVNDALDDKADKVSSATNGNLAGLNGSGNLTDSGWNGAKDTTSINGNPISISGLKANQLAVNPIITFEPIQAGSGAPSPVNQRPISGYDKVEALSGGLNLVDQTKCIHTGVATDTGQIDTSSKRLWTELVRVKPSTTYRATIVGSSSQNEPLVFNRVICYGKGKEFIRRIEGAQVQSGVYTVGDDVYYINLDIRTSALTTDISISNITSLMLTEGQPSVTYSPYVKTTSISESLGQTVYGGSLDVRTGKARVTRKHVKISDLTWQYWSSGGYFYTTQATDKAFGTSNVICSAYKTASNTENLTIYGHASAVNIHIRDDSYSGNVSNFVSAMGDQTICYELATPIEIQLTPHEISLLSNYAYVSTNGTNIALDYHNGELASLSDVAQVGETVNELGNRIDESKSHLGNTIILNSYTSANPYICDYDGYVYVSSGSASTGFIRVLARPQDSNANIAGISMVVEYTYQTASIYLRKGMRVYVADNSATGSSIVFYPLS